MPLINQPTVSYNDGSEMWRSNVTSHGIDKAIIISRNYLEQRLKSEQSSEEKQFCRGMFSELYHATANRAAPSRIVYPHDIETANERMEADYYHLSRRKNTKCSHDIDQLIKDSCYKSDCYNLETATMIAIQDYGFPRICLVLAYNIQKKASDRRISSANRRWANGFCVQDKAFSDTWLQSHSILIERFCSHIRELYHNLGAERYDLPGIEEHGEFVQGFEIKRAITTSDDGNGFSTGYAIGHNSEVVDQWVCWQFAVRDGVRHFNWGVYADAEQTVIDSYIGRVFAALN